MIASNLTRLTTRKQAIAQTRPQRFALVKRAAETLSRRNADQAVVELLAEALARLTVLCYERGDDGELCNVDPATGRLLIPAPFGRAGHKRWGLTPSEANVARRIMQDRRLRVGLFDYDRARRCWRLNLHVYEDYAAALAYWRRWPVTIAEYRVARAHVLGHGVDGA